METFELSYEQKLILNLTKKVPPALLSTPHVSLELKNKPDLDLLKESITLTCQRLKCCSLRLLKDSQGQLCQYLSDQELPPPVVVNFSQSKRFGIKKIKKCFSNLVSTPFPNDCIDVPLVKIAVAVGPEDRIFVLVCAHHLIMDGSALAFFLVYLDKVYSSLKFGTEMPPLGADPIEEVRNSNERRTSQRFLNNNIWWRKQFETLPVYTSFNGVNGNEKVKNTTYARPMKLLERRLSVLNEILPAEAMQNIKKDALERRFSPQSYFIFALRTYLSHVCQTEDVSIEIPVSGRATLKQKTAGLDMTNSFFHRTKLKETQTVAECLSAVDLALAEGLRHSYFESGSTLMDKLKAENGIPFNCEFRSVVMSYFADMDLTKSSLGYAVNPPVSKLAAYPVYLVVVPANADGDIYCSYLFGTGYIKRREIEKYHSFFIRFIPYIINNPNSTVEQALKAVL